MYRAMNSAASGMRAQERRMEAISNNLANVNTSGFKRVRVEFHDLFYENLAASNGTESSVVDPTGFQVGHGVRAAATLREFSMGSLRQTGNALDVAIEGAGFLQVRLPNGGVNYTRDGALRTDAQGRIVNQDGYPLEPDLVIPSGADQVTIGRDGTVRALVGDANDVVELGHIQLATFVNPSGLEARGQNLFASTEASGRPLLLTAGSDGAGALSQGMLELSNVKVVEEMIDLIATQRAYETSSQVIRAADEMLRSTSSLR